MSEIKVATNPFTSIATQARADWTAKQKTLKQCRDAYQNGASKRLAEIHTSAGKIGRKLKAEAEAKDKADAGFRSAYEAAGFEKTPAVQQLLNQRNDAIAISEALEVTTARLKDEHAPLFVQANQDASPYVNAHAQAYAAYSRMCAFEVLERLGPPILDAIDMLKSLGWDGDLLNELKDKVQKTNTPQASLDPIVGVLDLGPLSGMKLLSPTDMHLWRVAYSNESMVEPSWQAEKIGKYVESAFRNILNQEEIL